jgi:hypothetical protein
VVEKSRPPHQGEVPGRPGKAQELVLCGPTCIDNIDRRIVLMVTNSSVHQCAGFGAVHENICFSNGIRLVEAERYRSA